jgi:hypothetical protein
MDQQRGKLTMCVDGKVQASNARVVPSSASNFIQYLFPSSSLNLS